MIEYQLSDAQMGFRRNRSCTDAIYTLRQLSERAIEHNRTCLLAFIDQEKAFDRVDRIILWESMGKKGISNHLINICKSLYTSSTCCVRTRTGLSRTFLVNSGVRQGCVLSPLLFITYMDNICKETNFGHEEDITELLFADDQVLIAESTECLQNPLNQINNKGEEFNMRINTKKTEIMMIGRQNDNLEIKLGNNALRQTDEFKYLGAVFTSDGKLDKEISARCTKANQVLWQITPLLTHKQIPLSSKVNLIKTIFWPTLCYQCQTWALTSSNERKIVTTEMKCLRRAAGVSRKDRIRNQEIRRMLGIKPVLHVIKEQQIKWFAHLTRMPWYYLPQRATLKRYNGYRARGRPHKRWSDGIKNSLTEMNINLRSALDRAHQRTLHLPPTLH